MDTGQAASWHKLGDTFADQGEWEKAKEAYSESIRLKQEARDDEAEAITQDALAKAFINLGRLDDAVHAAARSWQFCEAYGTAPQKWYPLGQLIWLALDRNEHSTALDFARALTNHVRSKRNLSDKAERLLQLLEAGRTTEAREVLSKEGFGRSSVLSTTMEPAPKEIPAPESPLQEPRKASAASCSLLRRGQGWNICFKGDGPFQLKDTVGVQYLATLLGSPGESIHCSILASSKGRAAVSSSLTAENTPILTPEAKRAYRVKLEELNEQIATAESRGLVDEVVDLKEEVKKIGAALGAAHDKLGDDQSLTDDGNNIRNAVCNRIRDVMKSLRDDPQTRDIGLHLLDQVHLGFNCCYPKKKEKGFPWAVEQ